VKCINFVELTLGKSNPVGLVFVVVADSLGLPVFSPASIPPSYSNCGRAKGLSCTKRICRIERKTATIVARQIETVFSSLGSLKEAVKDLSNGVGIVLIRLEGKLKRALRKRMDLI